MELAKIPYNRRTPYLCDLPVGEVGWVHINAFQNIFVLPTGEGLIPGQVNVTLGAPPPYQYSTNLQWIRLTKKGENLIAAEIYFVGNEANFSNYRVQRVTAERAGGRQDIADQRLTLYVEYFNTPQSGPPVGGGPPVQPVVSQVLTEVEVKPSKQKTSKAAVAF